ncbi:MAG: flavodoxin-dependent (E)-4-hydroxy-3-methylbut-2-enyl-diphosphate synthase [bacterium]
MTRRQTRQIQVGPVAVGGMAPISVQTMTKTDTRNVAATVAQIREIESAGCDIVRLAVIDEDAALALGAIRREVKIPLVADIHFNHKLALIALESGIDGLRINPGNIGGLDRVREVVKAAAPRQVPIRIGVNAGSLEKELLEKHGGATAEALVESAMRHVRILEDAGHPWIKISVKASDVPRTLQAYRLLSKTTDHPLHLGVTEAGTLLNGTIRSSVAMGMLIAEGIGDTLRVSLTDHPVQEIRVGLELLRCLGLRPPGASVISCPTCGRIQIDVVSLAQRVEAELDKYYRANPTAPHPAIAVMGCVVNGPGEAREADIAIAGGQGKAALYVRGAFLATVPEAEILDRLMEQVKTWRD